MNEQTGDFKTPVDYESLNLDTLLNQIDEGAKRLTAENIDELMEDGILDPNKLKKNSGLFTTNIQIYKNYPSIIFNPKVAGDTDWWISVLNDMDGTDTDNLAFGTGTVPGTNTKVTFEHDGNVIIADGGDLDVVNGDILMNSAEQRIIWSRTDNNYQNCYLRHSQTGDVGTFGLFFSPRTSAPVVGYNAWGLTYNGTYGTYFSIGNGIATIIGSYSGNPNFSNATGTYLLLHSNTYMYYLRSFYIAKDASNVYKIFQAAFTSGNESVNIGHTANDVALKLFANSTTERVKIDKDGNVIITTFASAGFVKNDASGQLSGGNTISVADIIDIATTYLKLDGTNSMTGSVTVDSDSAGLILGDDQDVLIYSDGAGSLYLKPQAADTDMVLNFYGTTNSGKITWMEDESYFDFTDPISLDSNALLGTPVAGTLEFYNNKLYVTFKSTQRVVDRTSDVVLSSTTVTDTTTETTVFTGSVPANSLVAGNILKIIISGTVTNDSASDIATIKIYFGSTEMLSIDTPGKALSDADWHGMGFATIRSIGATGSMAYHFEVTADENSSNISGTSTVDTTAAEDITVKVTWNNAKVGNIFNLEQGFMEYKN